MAKVKKGKDQIDLSKRPSTTTRAADFVTIYANSAKVEASVWDIRIRLGQIEEASATQLVINEVVCVYMSPEHAKAFLKVLETGIENYEKLVAAKTTATSTTKP